MLWPKFFDEHKERIFLQQKTYSSFSEKMRSFGEKRKKQPKKQLMSYIRTFGGGSENPPDSGGEMKKTSFPPLSPFMEKRDTSPPEFAAI